MFRSRHYENSLSHAYYAIYIPGHVASFVETPARTTAESSNEGPLYELIPFTGSRR